MVRRTQLRVLERKADQVLPTDETIILKDGSRYTLAPDERLAAFRAAFEGRPHPFLDLIAADKIDLEANLEIKEYVLFMFCFQANAAPLAEA